MDDSVQQELIRLLPRLRRFARGLAGSDEEGDDLVQEACIRAIERIDQWKPGTRLDSWMYRMVQTIRIDRLRAGKVRERYAGHAHPHLTLVTDGEADAHARVTLDRVRRHIMTLPEDQRAVLMLICVDGHSYRDAADVLDLPIGTVMSRLSRARASLVAALDNDEETTANSGAKARTSDQRGLS